jgi:hypothetical protein
MPQYIEIKRLTSFIDFYAKGEDAAKLAESSRWPFLGGRLRQNGSHGEY